MRLIIFEKTESERKTIIDTEVDAVLIGEGQVEFRESTDCDYVKFITSERTQFTIVQ